MFLIDTSRNGQPVYDPIVNQSLDNYLINDLKLKGHGLIMYINDPAVIVGVNQNIFAEVNVPYLLENNIKLVRRTAGGGAVYHDRGNLVFENIIVGDPEDGTKWGDYGVFAQPILDALHEMGATQATLRGKSDLVIDNHKFTGMTMVKAGDGYAAGGTLMFDMDIDAASEALHPVEDKIHGKWVKSNRSEITNVKSYLAPQYQNLTSEEFKTQLLFKLFHVESLDEIETYHLTDQDWAIIDERLAEKYNQDNWNFGANPGFNQYRRITFEKGAIIFNFAVENGQISKMAIYGDLLSRKHADKLQELLTGVSYDAASLTAALDKRFVKHATDANGPSRLAESLLS